MCTLTIEEQKVIINELHVPSIADMDEKESEKVLKGKKNGTYLLRKDASGAHFLSGVGSEGELHHMRLEKSDQQWQGFNGGFYHSEHLKKLVCLCLKCESVHPLSFVKK